MRLRDDVGARIVDQVLQRQPACGATRVVAIDGPSGSGKTELANDLLELLGQSQSAGVLHLDDLHQGWRGLQAAIPLTTQILAAVAVGEVGSARQWDWQADDVGDELHIPPLQILLLEGVGSGARNIAPFLSLLIWVDAPAAERKARAFARDGATFRPWWDVWAAQENTHYAAEQTAYRADLRLTS